MKKFLVVIAISALSVTGFASAEEVKTPAMANDVLSRSDQILDNWSKLASIDREQVKLKTSGEFRYRL